MQKPVYPGDFVQIGESFFKIGGVEPFHYNTGEESTAIFSAVASGSRSGFKNVTELEPDADIRGGMRHMFWVTFGVEDGQAYFFKIPAGTNRFGDDVTKSIGFVDNITSPHYAPNSNFGFFLIRNYYPSIETRNDAKVALTPKIYFRGFKYDISPVSDPQVVVKLRQGSVPFKMITLGGIKEA